MNYRNGKDVLPPDLLKKLQEHIQGELVYIPKMEEKRAGWGTSNGTKMIIQMRNTEIFRLYKNGAKVHELIDKYHLSEDSIRKIIAKTNQLVGK